MDSWKPELITFDFFYLDTQEWAQSALRAHSSSVRGSRRQIKLPNESVVETAKFQDFIKEEVLVGIVNVSIVLILYCMFFFFKI